MHACLRACVNPCVQEGLAHLFEEHGPVIKIKFLPLKVELRSLALSMIYIYMI